MSFRKGVISVTSAHRAARRPTRACLQATTGVSEVDVVRLRLNEDREGPRGVHILDAEKASDERCAERRAAEAGDSE